LLADTPESIYLRFERANIHGEVVVVECYFSTPFPALRPSIQLELYGKIARASYLISVGHFAHMDILKLLDNYTIITNTNTRYACDESEDEDNFVNYLYKHPELCSKIRNVLVYHPQKLAVTTFPQIRETIKTILHTHGPDERYL
jgi:hypothetical protein